MIPDEHFFTMSHDSGFTLFTVSYDSGFTLVYDKLQIFKYIVHHKVLLNTRHGPSES